MSFDPNQPFEQLDVRFDPSKPFEQVEETSQLESGIHGLAQGATFGFADEIAGFAGAVKEQLSDWWNDEESGESFAQTYERRRDAAREMYGNAETSNPGTYMGGEILGSLAVPAPGATALKTGSTLAKIGRGAKLGAGIGALEAAGRTEKGLTSKEGIEDVLSGAAIGGALGGAIPLVGAGLSKGKKAITDRLSKVDSTSIREGALHTTPGSVAKDRLDPTRIEKRINALDVGKKYQIFKGSTKPEVMVKNTQDSLKSLGGGLEASVKSIDKSLSDLSINTSDVKGSLSSAVSSALDDIKQRVDTSELTKVEAKKAEAYLQEVVSNLSEKIDRGTPLADTRVIRIGLDKKLKSADYLPGGTKVGTQRDNIKRVRNLLRGFEDDIVGLVESRYQDFKNPTHPANRLLDVVLDDSGKFKQQLNKLSDEGLDAIQRHVGNIDDYNGLKTLEEELSKVPDFKIGGEGDITLFMGSQIFENVLPDVVFFIKKAHDILGRPKVKFFLANIVDGNYTPASLAGFAKIVGKPISWVKKQDPEYLQRLAMMVQKQTVSSAVEKNQ